MKTSIKKIFSMFIIFLMIMSICVPVTAREYYNYENRYTIELSEEAYEKMRKVNENLMSVILGDGVSITFATSNYYENLSEDEVGESEAEDYNIGSPVFEGTYNDAAYMKDEYFAKRLANVDGTTEMVETVFTQINGFDFWEMSYIYFGEPTAEDQAAETEGEESEETPTSNEEAPAPREDGLVQRGEGKMYFALHNGYMYNIHIICREGSIDDYNELSSIMDSINLGRRQTKTMLIMWIVIGVLCVILLGLIVLTLMAKSPKKIAKLRELEDKKHDFDEEEQLRNNEFVNEKLDRIAKEHLALSGAVAEITEEDVDAVWDEELVEAEIVAGTGDDVIEDEVEEVIIVDADDTDEIVETEDIPEDISYEEEPEQIEFTDSEDDEKVSAEEVEFDDELFDAYLNNSLKGFETMSLTLEDVDAKIEE